MDTGGGGISPKGRTDTILVQTTASTSPSPTSPVALTCAVCPFARHIEDNRYVCQVSETAADVVRGHWTDKVSCHEAIVQAKTEKVVAPPVTEIERLIAHIHATEETSIAPAKLSTTKTATTASIATAAIGTDDELPNRGDNGSNRVEPIAAPKKLTLTLVAVKRIVSNVVACNEDRNELEIAGEFSLAIGGFIIPPVVIRDSNGYKIISGHFQYHAAVVARQLNPKAGETILAIVLESENQTTAERTT
ncbi:hypothetical protein QUA41_30390 [Microcoleus sp. Pol11C1]|uniref:hypothetical protein n=1 Tax=unclassified Microcoleus TaxID=2642155 RepID=UPI002FD797A7